MTIHRRQGEDDASALTGAADHAWLRVRSLYFPDPEENLIEFVCTYGSLQ
jgi:catechol-2,3-dioxygenase